MIANIDDSRRDAGLVLRARSQDPEQRRVALMEAIDDAERYRDLFTTAARDPDAGVRLEAACGLEGATDEASLAALIGLLDDTDEEVQEAAREALSELPTREAGPLLVRHLASATGAAQAALLSAVRKLRLPEALTPALAALSDPLPAVRREAVAVLGYLQDERATPAIAQSAVGDESPPVRRSAIGALAFSQTSVARDAAMTALRDTDWQAREMAATTLARIRSSASVPALERALTDEFWQVRLKAAFALGQIGDASAAESLIAAFEHPVGNLRREIVQALDSLSTPKAIPLFEWALSDSDIDVRKAAARGLGRLT